MTELNKNAIKLSHMFDLDIDKVKKLYDIIGLSDLAALTTALNNDDMKSIKSIVSKYSSSLSDAPTPEAIKSFYDEASKSSHDPIADTADHFGIKEEDVYDAIKNEPAMAESTEEPFIADSYVKAAYDNIQEMLKGGKCKRGVFEALNMWQRRMMYGLIPDVVAKVIQGTIDMTPLALMQKQAEIGGYGEPAIKESEMSLHEMMENIIEHELNNFRKAKKEYNPDAECSTCGDKLDSAGECPTCDFEDVSESDEAETWAVDVQRNHDRKDMCSTQMVKAKSKMEAIDKVSDMLKQKGHKTSDLIFNAHKMHEVEESAKSLIKSITSKKF